MDVVVLYLKLQFPWNYGIVDTCKGKKLSCNVTSILDFCSRSVIIFNILSTLSLILTFVIKVDPKAIFFL
jgi:hypothetical protein